MESFTLRPNLRRGKTTISLLAAMLATHLFLLIKSYFLSKDLVSNYTSENVEIFFQNRIMLITGLISLLLYIITIICYIRWFRRAYYNLNQLTPSLKYENYWASLSWFIPIYHWIAPIQIMRELFVKTNSFFKGQNNRQPMLWNDTILTIWWILYITSGAFILVNSFYLETTLDGTIESLWLIDYYFYLDILNLFLIISALIVVWNYHQFEKTLHKLNIINIERINVGYEEVIDNDF